jgi:hypothetical protein
MSTVKGTRDSRLTALDGAAGRHEYRCTDCGYGAATGHAPPTCPMCTGESWAYRSYGSSSVTTVTPLRGGETYVLTPPSHLDAGSREMLAVAVCAIAELPPHPQILLDLAQVQTLDDSECIDLVDRLAAIALQAGGRLLAACPPTVGGELDRGGVRRYLDRLEQWWI